MEPWPAFSAAATRHESILKTYRFAVCDIPATVILPANLAHLASAWQDLLPSAVVEITRSSWTDMLSMPAVKESHLSQQC
jgi:hypothetical protein